MAESDQIKVNFWEDDQLDRKSAANNLEKYLTSRYKQKPSEDGFVLAINAEWGFGKTFMLECWQKELASKDYPVVYFDAWKNDFTPEPLVAFIAELDTGLKSFFDRVPAGKIAFRSAMGTAKLLLKPVGTIVGSAIAKHVIGMGLGQIGSLFESQDEDNQEETKDNEETEEKDSSAALKKSFNGTKESLTKAVDEALKGHKNTKQAIKEFRRKLELLIDVLEKESNVELPLFVFIDELDRCRPDYAIELLEGIKHLFGVRGIYFVIATNISQLSHSVKAIYGNDFDGTRYLKRFFDIEYTLPIPSNFNFAAQLFSQIPLPENRAFITGLQNLVNKVPDQNLLPYIFAKYSDYFDCGLRDQMQVMKILEAAFINLRGLNKNTNIHIHLIIFLAMLYQRSTQVFTAVVEKNKVSEMTSKMIELRINDTKGIFFTESFTRVNGQHEFAQSETSISEIAITYFDARNVISFNDFNFDSLNRNTFPTNLLNHLLQSSNKNDFFWKVEIDRHIDAVRYAGGFQ